VALVTKVIRKSSSLIRMSLHNAHANLKSYCMDTKGSRMMPLLCIQINLRPCRVTLTFELLTRE